jgi:glycine/D-amino acid oxidase-like deaminating enzyme
MRAGRFDNLFADAAPRPYWWDANAAPKPCAPVAGEIQCDLALVGGGFTGLWAALIAKERDPGREIVLVEAEHVAFGASGRNGGFAEHSLTHGLRNGLARYPEHELRELERVGHESFAALGVTLARHGIDARFEGTGVLWIATERHQVDEIDDEVELIRRFGGDARPLDAAATRSEVNTPLALGGVWHRDGGGLLDPVALAYGLRRAVLAMGVRICERSPVSALRSEGSRVVLECPGGRVLARRAVLGTSAYPPLVRSVQRRMLPVYDYVLVTEPLSPAQRASIGWGNRQGLTDGGNQFHYFRLTADDRILYGGYDAIYHWRNRVAAELDQRHDTFSLLAEHLLTTFPQLEGIRFTHRWGGAIDTCSRFFAFYGTALGGRVSYAVGHTGLGVGATRFGAEVALDLADGRDSPLVRLPIVRDRPRMFPPEPLRAAGVALTRHELARADRNAGRRGLYLRALDRLGLGFDS